MKRLRVLLPVHVFFPTHFYGTETYTLELAKSLTKLGHEPVILTATPYGEKGAGTLHSTYEYDELTVHCIDLNLKPHSRFKDTYYRPDLYPILEEIITRIKPDIAHVTHLINHSSSLLEVLRDARIPAIATLTDFFGICFNNKLERYDATLCEGPDKRSTNCLCCYVRKVEAFSKHPFWGPLISNDVFLRMISRMLPLGITVPGFRKGAVAGHVLDVTRRINTLRYLYSAYRYLVAPTDFLFEAYASNSFYPERLRKINFGINLALVKDYQRPRRKPGSGVRFGYIGQLTSHKGADLLIRAFLRLKGDNKSLVLYGPQDQDPAYMQGLFSLASGDQGIEFRGTFPQRELPRRLSEIDVLVIPSRWYENSPLVLLYSLAAKTPVIATDVKGMSEFVRHGFNGFTFAMNSVEHLAETMQHIIDEPGMIERLSDNAVYANDVLDHTNEVCKLYDAAIYGKE